MNKLRFFDKKPDCLVCLSGDFPDFSFFDEFSDIPIIAADGAANELLQYSIIPSFIVGDLDSFIPHFLPAGAACEIIQEESQEINDFEKSMLFALKKGYKHIVITGLHGGDLEHSLNNVSVLWKLFPLFTTIVLVDSSLRIAIPVDRSFSYSAHYIGEIVSLIPSPHALLTTSGLQWNLENEALEFSVREGARNRVEHLHPEILIHEGRLLFFCDSRFPLIPIINE